MLKTAQGYPPGDWLSAARTFKVEVQAGRQDLPHDLPSSSPSMWAGSWTAYPNLKVDVPHPELTVYLEVRDYAAYVHADPRARCGRSACGHQRPGGQPALRRHRLPRGLLDDPPSGASPWRWSTTSPTPIPLRSAKQKVLTLAKATTPGADGSWSMWCPSPPSRRSAPQVPRGLFTIPHAPLYDAHCREGGRGGPSPGPSSPASVWARWPARPWRP